ncbi:spore germination protein [Paenibacillus sepulcri]|uniref:Spore germination protein n=2 Tax=Paenibacillus sepulcri TaxID=359917 RepID=A0ABS7BZM2_9BACL|nr:spore germination protein [Paenibacillus sepulcri]
MNFEEHTKQQNNADRISVDLKTSEQHIKEIFANCQDIIYERFHFGPSYEGSAAMIYCAPLTQEMDGGQLNSALQDLVPESGDMESIQIENIREFFERRSSAFQSYELLTAYNEITEAVLDGYAILIFDGWDKVVSLDAGSVERRQVEEPTSEAVVNGPREGMVEQLDKNIALIRLRLRTPDLKIEMYQAGTLTKTRFLVGYVDGKVDPSVLAELKKRLEGADKVDALDTNYIREFVEDSVYSPFSQYRVTERPDVAVGSLLEGKIILMADGTTSAMICPTFFTELFQSAEDYYQRPVISTLIRFLRIAAFFIALTLPSLYIALSNFHPELIPTTLLLKILDTREGIPFPAFIEAVIMQFFFELLREAGIRLPRPIGSAVSIVGCLIIGEASIRAGIASPIMIIIISLTGMASFSMPQYELAIALRILLFPLMVLAFMWGGFGLMIGYILIFLHLATLRTLGKPFFSPIAPMRMMQMLDVFVRVPTKLRMRAAAKAKRAADLNTAKE